MRQFFGKSVSFIALGLLAGSLLGCADARHTGLIASWPPWREKDEIPAIRYDAEEFVYTPPGNSARKTNRRLTLP